ncbi:MAG: hypothetical protein M1812_001934 [Candelaria pacifica]|nr:MAG: hypothetical protein M1812_001934 [Candelaria pacifica]
MYTTLSLLSILLTLTNSATASPITSNQIQQRASVSPVTIKAVHVDNNGNGKIGLKILTVPTNYDECTEWQSIWSLTSTRIDQMEFTTTSKALNEDIHLILYSKKTSSGKDKGKCVDADELGYLPQVNAKMDPKSINPLSIALTAEGSNNSGMLVKTNPGKLDTTESYTAPSRVFDEQKAFKIVKGACKKGYSLSTYPYWKLCVADS